MGMLDKPPFDPDERIISEKRRHWFFLAVKLAVVVFMAILPLVAGGFLLATPIVPVTDYGLSAFLGFYVLWLFLLWVSVFYMWTVFILDMWIITDKKFIDIEQIGLFHREIATLSLEDVQDVTVEVAGIFATWLDFGKVTVQTAGQEREFIIGGIRNPYDFKQTILESCDAHRKRVVRSESGV
jgi:hypothetical protein